MLHVHRVAQRAVRWFLVGSGPLKRGTDRVQALARVLLVVIALAAVPAALRVGTSTGDRLTTVATEQANARFRTRAVLLQDARTSGNADPVASGNADPVASGIDDTGSPVTAAKATWRTRQGTLHVGTVPAPPGARAGQAVPVWVAADGRLTSAPLDHAGVISQALTAGIVTFVGAVSAAWVMYGLAVWGLARRRDREWTRDWAAVGPIWRTHLH